MTEGRAESGSWTSVARSDEVQEGAMFVAPEVGEAGVLLTRVGGEVYAVDAVCTHALGYLDEGELVGFEVECPLHAARFDVRTGEVTKRPAKEPLRCYAVTEREGSIFVADVR